MRRAVLPVVLLVAALAAVGLLLLTAPGGPWGGGGGASGDEAAPPGGGGEGRAPTLVGSPREALATTPGWIQGAPVGRLVLEDGTAALEGRVTGAGEPLPGAIVAVVLEPRRRRAAVATDAEGAWRIEGLPEGSFKVRARCEGWGGRTRQAPAVAAGETARVDDLDLQPARAPDGVLRVRVLDPFDRPVPDARVLATTLPWSAHLAGGPEALGVPDAVGRTARTDRDGEAAFTGLPPETYDVVALAPGFQPGSQPAVQLGRGRTRLLVFRLREGTSIRGVLTDPEGTPLAGGYVAGMHAETFTMAPTVRTGEDGAFTLDGLREGGWMLFAFHDEHGELTAPGIPAPSAGHRLALPGAGHVSLRVVRPDGSPVTAYRVRPYDLQPFGYLYSRSLVVEDPDGRTRFTHPAGNLKLAVQSMDGDHDAETEVRIEIGRTQEVEVVLAGSASVSGVVTDEDGHHVSGAEVYVRHGGFPTGPTWEQYARTDGNGAFTVRGLGAEKIRLHVTHASYADRVVEVEPVAEGEGREITVVMERGASIAGTVTRDGAPLANEQVNLMQQMQWWDARSTRTDGEGRYRFDAVGEGTWTVTTGVFEFMAKGAVREGVVVGASGEVAVDLDVGGAGGPGVVAGVVSRAGTPVAGATVTVIDARGWEGSVEARTDAEGAYRAEGILPGSATLYVRSADGMTTATEVVVPEDGSAAPGDVAFGAGSLAGRLVGEDGAPVSGAWITIERREGRAGSWSQRAGALSDVEGRFSVAGLEDGGYRLRVAGGAHAALLTPGWEIAAGQALDVGTLRLEAGTTLSGRVADDRGEPVEDATITLEDAAGRPVVTFSLVTTGSDGRYRMTGLAPGRYVVGFEARGYAPARVPVEVGAGGATADGTVARGGAVEVLVTTPDGAPLPGVRAGLEDERGNPVRRTLSFVNLEDPGVGRTDAQGRVVLSDLAPGLYVVDARLGGHRPDGDPPTVRIESGARATVRLTLVAGP